MDRRLLLLVALSVGCAQGSLEGPGSFGLPTSATMTTQSDTDDDDGETEDETDDDGDGDGDGDTGPSTQSSTDPSTDAIDESSSSAPITTAVESSDDGASLDDSASAEDSSSSDPSASASNSDDGASMDDGVEPPPDAGPWENCEAAVCEVGTDCLTVNGVVGEAYCSPQCVDDLDCPYADTGDATPYCLLVDEGDVDPTNCTLVCEVDGLDYGTCPNGMTCTSVPGQDPSVSLCMW